MALGGFMVAFFWTIAALLFLAGRWLGRHTHSTFCFAIACVACIFTPTGTVLGVFTILVLLRPSVKALFVKPLQ